MMRWKVDVGYLILHYSIGGLCEINLFIFGGLAMNIKWNSFVTLLCLISFPGKICFSVLFGPHGPIGWAGSCFVPVRFQYPIIDVKAVPYIILITAFDVTLVLCLLLFNLCINLFSYWLPFSRPIGMFSSPKIKNWYSLGIGVSAPPCFLALFLFLARMLHRVINTKWPSETRRNHQFSIVKPKVLTITLSSKGVSPHWILILR